MDKSKKSDLFSRFASASARAAGNPLALISAGAIVVIWGLSGPAFHFSDTWQLVINTGTTVITFLMVFLIQNSQNRDSMAMHLKLDELIRSVKDARNNLIDSENMTQEDLDRLSKVYARLAERAEAKKKGS
jgi:low affinity Fe/Cu permease